MAITAHQPATPNSARLTTATGVRSVNGSSAVRKPGALPPKATSAITPARRACRRIASLSPSSDAIV